VSPLANITRTSPPFKLRLSTLIETWSTTKPQGVKSIFQVSMPVLHPGVRSKYT
jgi:hypothetical protein